jgi:hypothetical protein
MTIQPGRKLDILVAQNVMGWKYEPKYVHNWSRPDDRGLYQRCDESDIPKYSTDMGKAWEIVEHLKNSKTPFRMMENLTSDPKFPCWAAAFDNYAAEDDAISAPHALCLAALIAMGVDVSNED